MSQTVSRSLEACMHCYCQSRNLCAAAAVVEHLVERLQDAEDDAEACLYLALFRKWVYITGCHYRSDRFTLTRRVPARKRDRLATANVLPGERATAQIIEFRPRSRAPGV